MTCIAKRQEMKFHHHRLTIVVLISITFSLWLTFCKAPADPIPVAPDNAMAKVMLGRAIFMDTTLSNPPGQSCNSCHDARTAFSDPNHAAISEGAVKGRFEKRNAPSLMYVMFNPPLRYDSLDETYIGGLFLDGRVNTLEEQVRVPLLNPLEMNITGMDMLASKIKSAPFYSMMSALYGTSDDPDTLLAHLADAIAAFERSPELNPFTSKFDYYLRGEATLTSLEQEGLALFKDTTRAMCVNCHILDPDPVSGKVLLTDYTYDNIGASKNPKAPFLFLPATYNPEGQDFLDLGLGRVTGASAQNGQFKVPTLRNVAVTAPYLHHGLFKTLEEVVHFYNSRDTDPVFGPPEVKENINTDELGDLKLTTAEESALVAFLKTLTDGYQPQAGTKAIQ